MDNEFGNPNNNVIERIEGPKLDEAVWDKHPLERGRQIEDYLTNTEYSEWQRTDNLVDPKTNKPFKSNNFPLVDFQKDNNLVSLKTVDTKGSYWGRDMEKHIIDLSRAARNPNTHIDGEAPNMILDIRVPKGEYEAAKHLESFGERNKVIVIIKEIGG